MAPVRVAKSIFVLLLLGVWLPATAHCGLEMVGLFSSQECCETEAAGNHGCEDGCTVVEDGGIKTECDQLVPEPPLAYTLLPQLSLTIVEPSNFPDPGEHLFESQSIPQFVIQTALPIRGPSFFL